MESLQWDDVRVLLALVRRGSLKGAAESLQVNISTVSRRLDALERTAGVRLFDRTAEGSLPTAVAEQLIPLAETMEQAALGMAQTLDGLEVEPAGVVRITAPPGVVDHFLAAGLVDLHAAYPQLRVEILSSISYADLTRREADLALRILRPTAGDLVVTRLATDTGTIIAAPATARCLGRLGVPGEARWVTWDRDLAHLPDARWVAEHVPEEAIVLRTSSMTAQIEAVRAGLGVMIAPTAYAQLNGLTRVDLAPKLRRSIATLPESSLWLVGHRAMREVPRIAAVWEWLRRRFDARSL